MNLLKNLKCEISSFLTRKALYNEYKNDDLVPQSIIFPLGSGNIISPHKRE